MNHYPRPSIRRLSVPLAAVALFSGCGQNQPVDPETTCYATTVGPHGNNIRSAGLVLLEDYYGASPEGYTGLKSAATTLKERLDEQRKEAEVSTAFTPKTSDIISFCFIPKDPGDHDAGGRVVPGPTVKAIDQFYDIPEDYQKLPERTIFQIDPNGAVMGLVDAEGH
ncbi:MAG: hypothetical protein WBO35_01415 [Candidatus Saccharimonadales bacterium]|jgi:hypothetical protein